MQTRVLSITDIASIVPKVGLNALQDDLIGRLHDDFEALDPNQAQIPPRTGQRYKKPDLGLLERVPAFAVRHSPRLHLGGSQKSLLLPPRSYFPTSHCRAYPYPNNLKLEQE